MPDTDKRIVVERDEIRASHSLFPYLAEPILEKLISGCDPVRAWVLEKLGYRTNSRVEVFRQVPIAFHPSQSQIIFDGEHKIDLLLLIDSAEFVAMEVKAGAIPGLVKECTTSHNGTRIAGNMLAILNRRFQDDNLRGHQLQVLLGKELYDLSRKWGVIAPGSMIGSWNRKHSFDGGLAQPTLLDIRELCSAAGAAEFNSVVDSLIGGGNYFDQWVSSAYK